MRLQMTSRFRYVRGALVLLSITALAAVGVLMYQHKPFVSITIENCSAQEFFRLKLDESGINYQRMGNGDFVFNTQTDIDKMEILTSGNLGTFIPDSVETQQFKNCP